MNLRKDHYRRFFSPHSCSGGGKRPNLFRTRISGQASLNRDKVKRRHLRGDCRPRRPLIRHTVFSPVSPHRGSRCRREWEVSRPSPSGRSADWRRAAWPCTLGRPGVQVAKGSSIPISSPYGRGGLIRAFESVSVGGRLPGRLALTSPAPRIYEACDRLDSSLFFTLFLPFRSH